MRSVTRICSVVLAAAIVACGGSSSTPAASTPANQGSTAATPTLAATLLTATPLPATATAGVPPLPVSAAADRFRVAKIGIDAPMERALVSDGKMPDPSNPDVVAIFDFSSVPGFGGTPAKGNAVISGRQSSGTAACKGGTVPPPCPGVFFEVFRLAPGDELSLTWQNQTYVYKVALICNYDRASFPVHLVASRPVDVLTLLSDANNTRNFQNVVIGEKVPGSVPPTCPAGSTPGFAP